MQYWFNRAKGAQKERLEPWVKVPVGKPSQLPEEPPQKPKIKSMNRSDVVALMRQSEDAEKQDYFSPYQNDIAKGQSETIVAMDSCYDGEVANYAPYFGAAEEGTAFLGYPRLALMASARAEYRHIATAMAEDATREWGEFFQTSEEDKSKRILELEAEFDRLNVRALCAKALEHNDTFGIGQIFVDMGYDISSEKNNNPLLLDPATVKKGSIKSLNSIEPVWTAPTQYNSSNALRDDFYKPKQWWVMGAQVHSSRLLRFVSREVSDLLKPSYNFGGVPLIQMAKPYVDNWLRTRQSVSDLINGCSIVSLRTNMESILQNSGIDGIISRIEAFTRTRSNRGVFLTDQQTEELSILSANLAGLGELQNQSLEQLCVVAQMPLVKFAGIQPAGLNATSDGEIRVWYDHVSCTQERVLLPNINKIKHLAMLNIWGEIDHDIHFRFIPLWQLDEAQRATVEKTKAEIRAIYVEMGVTDATETRKALSNDDNNPLDGADLSGDAYPPMTPEEEGKLRSLKTFGE